MSRLGKSSNPVSKSSGLAKTHAGLVFVRRFQNALARTKLLPRGSRIVVAVSGGPDSMALLILLARLRTKHDFTLHIAHVNYQMRGQDSERDEALVRKTCRQYGLPCSIFSPKVNPGSNIEETLRDIRYRFFERVREKTDFDAIATAHNMNDIAETFLLNLLRGSGLAGLSPFQRRHSSIVRPLLSFSRSEIEAFLRTENIPSRQDRSNRSKRFTRNRVRHELLPLLETFNPSIVNTLSRTASLLGRKHRSNPKKS